MSTKKQKKSSDPLKKIKSIAYTKVVGPLDGNIDYDSFLRMAKSYLAIENKILFKDPIWDTYTEEELLVEYFSHIFMKFPDRRGEFEMEMNVGQSEYDSFLEFANKAIEENQKELQARDDELPDSVSFSPDVIGED